MQLSSIYSCPTRPIPNKTKKKKKAIPCMLCYVPVSFFFFLTSSSIPYTYQTRLSAASRV